MTNHKPKKMSTTILIGKISYILLIILTSLLLFKIIKMDVLPVKYLILIIVFLFLILFIIGFLLFKKGVKFFVKIFNVFLTFILITIVLISMNYLNKTVDFLNTIKNKLYQTEEYYLVTLKDSKYTSLKDLNEKTIGIYKDEINNNYNNLIIDMLNGMTVYLDEYDSYMDAANVLLEGKEEVILISASYKSLVEDSIEDFYDKTKIIHKYSIKIKSASIEKEVNVSKEPFSIFISGIDSYGDITTVARSDVNIVATVNPSTYDVLITSIPRDYYVQLYNTTGYKDKLTHSGMYGINTTVKTVEDLLDIDINYYVRLNFSTVVKLVNAIDGIDVDSPTNFTAKANKNCTYIKGNNHLNGKCSLAFVRERYAFNEGDRQRIKNQQEVIKAVIKKAMSSKTIVSKYSKILKSFGGSFETNMSTDKIYDLVKLQLGDMPKWNIETQSLEGYDAYEYTYTPLGNIKPYVMIPEEKSVIDAKANIKKILDRVNIETKTSK